MHFRSHVRATVLRVQFYEYIMLLIRECFQSENGFFFSDHLYVTAFAPALNVVVVVKWRRRTYAVCEVVRMIAPLSTNR
ncbi:hypothetical protein NDU88_000451 [Pleurodeles waltl]|uniref:Secreted protein n=1 Tax=Pleurodeles waltl TaxID=8319 RepID=A0AAV7TFI3_PLEWA|nr:hypothetical protein NDU88_000451 [Pleurodeles waltl]